MKNKNMEEIIELLTPILVDEAINNGFFLDVKLDDDFATVQLAGMEFVGLVGVEKTNPKSLAVDIRRALNEGLRDTTSLLDSFYASLKEIK